MVRGVSSNLLHGRSIVDGQVDTGRYVRALSALEPAVLAMQEVDRFQPRSDNTDQTAQIAAAVAVRFFCGRAGFPVFALDAKRAGEGQSDHAFARATTADHTRDHRRAHRKMVRPGRPTRAKRRYHPAAFGDKNRLH